MRNILNNAKNAQTIEENIAAVIEALEDLDSSRQECLYAFTQNASDQEQEFGQKPRHYQDVIEWYESFEEWLDDATNHVRHAHDIVSDKIVYRLFGHHLGYR